MSFLKINEEFLLGDEFYEKFRVPTDRASQRTKARVARKYPTWTSKIKSYFGLLTGNESPSAKEEQGALDDLLTLAREKIEANFLKVSSPCFSP